MYRKIDRGVASRMIDMNVYITLNNYFFQWGFPINHMFCVCKRTRIVSDRRFLYVHKTYGFVVFKIGHK